MPAAGEYTLFFTGEGGQGNNPGGAPPSVALSYEVKEGIIVSRYFLGLTVLFAVLLAEDAEIRDVLLERRSDVRLHLAVGLGDGIVLRLLPVLAVTGVVVQENVGGRAGGLQGYFQLAFVGHGGRVYCPAWRRKT